MKRLLDDTDLPDRTKRLNTGQYEEEKEDSSSPIQHTKSGAWQRLAKRAGFFDLPRELRDQIYDLCLHDLPYVLRGRRDIDDLASNFWEIGYLSAPNISALLHCHQMTTEYMTHTLQRMHVEVHLSIQEDSITTGAPWHQSLPKWVREEVRGVRLIVSLGHDSSCGPTPPPQRFDVQDMYRCLQLLVDHTAATLPSLHSMDVMFAYPVWGSLRNLEADIANGLQPRILLNIRPVSTVVPAYRCGFLIDLPPRLSPEGGDDPETGYAPLWLEMEVRENEAAGLPYGEWTTKYDEYEGEGDDSRYMETRWHATLSDQAAPRSFLSMDWNLLGTTLREEDAHVAPFATPRFSDDEQSEVSSDEESDIEGDSGSASGDEEVVAEANAEVARANAEHIKTLDESLQLLSITRGDGSVVRYNIYGGWLSHLGEALREFEPETADWVAVRELGGDLREAAVRWARSVHTYGVGDMSAFRPLVDLDALRAHWQWQREWDYLVA